MFYMRNINIKYGDVFMFNTIDATDLSPYSRLVYVANEYFVNMKGEFMIGDSLVVDKVYTDFKERQQQFTVSTRSSVSDLSSINEAYSRQKDRKSRIIFICFIRNNTC